MIRRSSAFTLLEMLIASALAAILMGGVLTLAAGLSRDRRRFEDRSQREPAAGALDLLRSDLANASAMLQSPEGDAITLVGHGALDPTSLTSSGRLARITWRIHHSAASDRSMLVREQAYLDDPVRPRPFAEIASIGATGLAITPISNDGRPVRLSDEIAEKLLALSGRPVSPGTAAPALSATRIPSRLRIRLLHPTGTLDREVILR